MYVCVHMYVYMFMCVCVITGIKPNSVASKDGRYTYSMSVCMCVYVCIYVYVCVRDYWNLPNSVASKDGRYICMYMYVCVSFCMLVLSNGASRVIHTYVYIHMHIFTYMQA
jgi:hypothetical protein